MKKLISLLLIATLIVAVSACGAPASPAPSESPSAANSPTEAVSEAPQTSAGTDASAAPEATLHPIYTYNDALSLGGVKTPFMESRADVDKALPTEKKEVLKIGATMVSQSTAWFVQVGDAVKNKASEYGWDASLLVCEFDPQKQSEQVDTFITQGVDAIVLDSADLATGKELCARANQAGIPVVGIGQQLELDANIITSIMSNSYQTAWNVGTIAAQKLEGKSIKAGALLGMLGSNSSESRMNGFFGSIIFARAEQAGKPMVKEDAMMAGQKMIEEMRSTGKASYPDLDFEIVASNGDARWTEQGGLDAALTMLTGNSDINLLLVDQDFMGVGAVKAIDQLGLKAGGDDGIQVVCAADSYKPAMDYIKEGKMLATGYSAPDTIGESAVELLHKIFVDGYDANNMVISQDLPPIAIDATNVDQYYDPDGNFAKKMPIEFVTIDEYNAANAK
jgi:ribose transport system substrate-binding protein